MNSNQQQIISVIKTANSCLSFLLHFFLVLVTKTQYFSILFYSYRFFYVCVCCCCVCVCVWADCLCLPLVQSERYNPPPTESDHPYYDLTQNSDARKIYFIFLLLSPNPPHPQSLTHNLKRFYLCLSRRPPCLSATAAFLHARLTTGARPPSYFFSRPGYTPTRALLFAL